MSLYDDQVEILRRKQQWPINRYRAWKIRLYDRCEPLLLRIAHVVQRWGLLGEE